MGRDCSLCDELFDLWAIVERCRAAESGIERVEALKTAEPCGMCLRKCKLLCLHMHVVGMATVHLCGVA